jgi:hypothetical protein
MNVDSVLEASISIRYDAETVPAGGCGDAPRNMRNSPTLSGVSSPTT